MDRIKFGFLCGVVAAALFLVGDFWLGSEDALLDPESDPNAFGEIVTSSAFSFWAARGMVGVILETIFAIALWHYLSRTNVEAFAWYGAIFSIIGDFFGMLMFGVAYFLTPQVGALIEAGETIYVVMATPSPLILIGMSVPTFIGLFFSVYAIWKSQALPMWATGCWLMGMMLVPIQIGVVQLLASSLWLAAGIGFLVAIWPVQSPPTENQA